MGQVSIREALQAVADNPEPTLDPIDTKVHELVGRALFEIANNPNSRQRGSMARATRAQKLILNRLVGLRRPGSHPAGRKDDSIDFVDLTVGVLE